jgi:hypothetical protein
LPVGRGVGKFALEPFVEQRAVRQVGQRVVMGEVGDALLGAAALGEVVSGADPEELFMGRQPESSKPIVQLARRSAASY